MDNLYGKIRFYGTSGTVTITSPKGYSRTVTLSGTFTDVILQGMEEYTITYGGNSQTQVVNVDDFIEITL